MANQDSSLIKELKDLFPTTSWTWAVPALRRDPLVWEIISDPEFRSQAADLLGDDPQRWTPARLGVLAVNQQYAPGASWPVTAFQDLPGELRGDVHRLYQDQDNQVQNKHLVNACLFAFALLSEREAGKPWTEIVPQLTPPSGWSTPLSCLLGFSDLDLELVREIPAGVGLSILLAQPLPPEQLHDVLLKTLTGADGEGQIEWLRAIHQEHPALAVQIAGTLITHTDQDLKSLEDILQRVELHKLAGQSDRALELIDQASALQRSIKTSLVTDQTILESAQNQIQLTDPRWAELKKSLSSRDDLAGNLSRVVHLINALLEKEYFSVLENLVEILPQPYPEHPALLSALAAAAFHLDQPDRARELALAALDHISEQHPAPAQLGRLLLELELIEETITASSSTLGKTPYHLPTLTTLAEAYDARGNHTQAVDQAQLAVLKSPKDLDLRRQFASYLEKAAAWDEALEERSLVLAELQDEYEIKSNGKPHLPHDDLQALANCAFRAGQHQRAATTCKNILNDRPHDALAHVTLGKSLAELGELDSGLKHLNQAVELSPEMGEAWLALADIKAREDDPQAAVNLLNQGANAAAEQAGIYLKLSQVQEIQSAPAEALKSLQKAADRMDKENVDRSTEYQIRYQLAEAYSRLGHLPQARETVRELYQRFPGNQEANALYGHILLEMDQPRAALPYLSRVVEAQPGESQPYVQYADAQLQIGANPKFAAQALEKALTIDPRDQTALALQGEAEAALGNHQQALESFREALESSLSSDPRWGPRLSLGFGKEALAVGQIETAVATLKEGCTQYPQHLGLKRGLAEAYLQADLTPLALETARESFQGAPEDIENLTWTANFALQAGSAKDAVPALEQIIQLQPEQITAYLQLGEAQKRNGSPDKAAEALAEIIDLEDAAPDDLYQAGDQLLSLGDLPNGMKALKKGANICQANPALDDQLPKSWARLAVGYERNGDPGHALDLLDKAIAAQLNVPRWRVQKADLLIRLNRFQAALASLKNALELSPDHPAYHYKLAVVHRQVTDYPTALYHAQAALKGYLFQEQPSPQGYHQALETAAHLAAGNLQTHLAQEILQTEPPYREDQAQDLDQTSVLCLQAELALEEDQEVKAADLINQLVADRPHHTRVLALQARMLLRQGNHPEAETVYQEALTSFKKGKDGKQLFPSAVPLAVAGASREFQDWNQAAAADRQAVEAAPHEPRARFSLTRDLVLRAEFEDLAQALKVSCHSPGIQSAAPAAHDEFQLSLSALEDLGLDGRLISKWEARGEAAFTPNQDTAKQLDEIAVDLDDLGALMAVYRNNRRWEEAARIAGELMDDLGETVYLDAQIALVSLKTDPQKAQRAADSAREQAREEYPAHGPMFQVLSALACKGTGRREAGYQAVSQAVETWPDEPRWHALAASLSDDPDQGIRHLETALDMEPEFPGHYLQLGDAHLQNNQAREAVSVLEQGLELTPEHTEIWLTLARAYRMMGELGRAFHCADRAAEISPDHLTARKMAAELAYQGDDFASAEKHLSVLLHKAPQDPEALNLLSRTLAAQNEPEEALKIIDQALARGTDQLEMKLQRAALIQEIEGPHAAVDTLRVINSEHPGQYPVILDLVETLSQAGETDQAISTAQQALHQEDLEHTRDQKAELHLVTGRLLRKSGHLDQAVHHLHQAKKLAQDSHQAYLELGCLHHDRRQHDQALEYLLKAIELESEDARAYYHAGRVLKDLREFSRAENMLRRASKLAPHDLRIHRQLGVLVTLNLVHGDSKVEAYG